MSFPKPAYRVDFLIDAVYYRDDGSEFARHSTDTYVQPWWDNAQHGTGEGWTEPGNWERGVYRVDLFVQGALVASGEFQVK